MNENVLIISKCRNCHKTFWPLQKYCSNCFSDIESIPASKIGTIVEFSKKQEEYFCMTEFDKIRLICKLKSNTPPKIGQKVEFLNHKKQNGQSIFEITDC